MFDLSITSREAEVLANILSCEDVVENASVQMNMTDADTIEFLCDLSDVFQKIVAFSDLIQIEKDECRDSFFSSFNRALRHIASNMELEAQFERMARSEDEEH